MAGMNGGSSENINDSIAWAMLIAIQFVKNAYKYETEILLGQILMTKFLAE